MEEKNLIVEINLLQGCINRMAHNSFLLKGWCITVLSAVFALIYKNADMLNIFIGCIVPIVIFWSLDAYFLRLERIYRKRYEWVIRNRNDENQDGLFELNPKEFCYNIGFGKTMFSNTLLPIYGIPLLIALFAEIYFFLQCCFCCVC